MTRWIAPVGIGLGVLGLLWSVFTSFAFAALVAIVSGQGAILLLIPILGFIAGALAIVGGVVGRKTPPPAAPVVLTAGLVSVFGPIPVAHVGFGGAMSLMNVASLTLLTGWWGYGLIIAGIVATVTGREESPR